MALPFFGYNRLTQGYGPAHMAYDIVPYPASGAVPGDALVRAVADGVVGQSLIIQNRNDPTWQWGHYVRVDSADKRHYVFYCHLAQRLVSTGQQVKAGDALGVMGNTGYSFGAHVHLEVRRYGTTTAVDPRALLAEMPNAAGSVIDYPAPKAPVPAAPAPAPSVPSGAGTYTVQKGDSLSAIAARYGTTWQALAAANPAIADPNLIYPGQVLAIPSAGAGSAGAAGFAVGSRVRVNSGATDWNGTPLAAFVYETEYFIRELSGQRAVIAPAMSGAITAAISTANLRSA